jgi:transposase
MLILVERLMIKKMYNKGVSIRAITHRTGRERKSIWQKVTTSVVAAPKSRKKQARKIDPYMPYLESRICDYFLNG